MERQAWKRRARQLSAQTYALYLAYRHPRTPWTAKVFTAVVVGYVFSPIDPIPDKMANGEKTVSRVAMVVVALWLLCVALAVLLALRVF